MLQFDILQVQFQEGKVSPATAELYKVLKDHKNPFMQDLVSSSFKHCMLQDEARKVVGHDGLCPHRKARTALTTRRRTGDVHQAKTQNSFLHTFLRHFIRLSVSTVALLVGQNPEKKTSPCRKPVVHWTAEENNQFFPVAATPSKLVFCSSDYFQSVLFDVIC